LDIAKLSFVLFTVFSSLRIVSYIPQIRRVALDDNGASAISYSTWMLWTSANLATALYASVNLGDTYLAAVSGIYAACCSVVIVLTMLKRRWLRMRILPSRHSLPRSYVADGRDPESALRATVHDASVALAANRRPHYTFERDLAAHARGLIWHDLAKALGDFASSSFMGRPRV